MDSLFPDSEIRMDSPRLLWIRVNAVETHRAPEFLVGTEDDYGDTINRFYVQKNTQGGYDKQKIGHGMTEDEALSDFAIKHKIPLWNETP